MSLNSIQKITISNKSDEFILHLVHNQEKILLRYQSEEKEQIIESILEEQEKLKGSNHHHQQAVCIQMVDDKHLGDYMVERRGSFRDSIRQQWLNVK